MSFSYRISLQVRHPATDPRDIAAGIGRRPHRSWAAGAPRTTPKGTLLTGNYPESYCAFDFGGGNDGNLAGHLRRCVAALGPAEAYIADLRRTGGKLNFYVTWSPNERGETFDIALLADLARVGIDLGVEPICERPEDRDWRV